MPVERSEPDWPIEHAKCEPHWRAVQRELNLLRAMRANFCVSRTNEILGAFTLSTANEFTWWRAVRRMSPSVFASSLSRDCE